jgi:hypothetical protein
MRLLFHFRRLAATTPIDRRPPDTELNQSSLGVLIRFAHSLTLSKPKPSYPFQAQMRSARDRSRDPLRLQTQPFRSAGIRRARASHCRSCAERRYRRTFALRPLATGDPLHRRMYRFRGLARPKLRPSGAGPRLAARGDASSPDQLARTACRPSSGRRSECQGRRQTGAVCRLCWTSVHPINWLGFALQHGKANDCFRGESSKSLNAALVSHIL